MTETNKNVTHKPKDPEKEALRAERKKQRKITNGLIVGMLVVSAVTIIALIINVVRIASSTDTTISENDQSLSSDVGTIISNDQYTIGNNPTDIQREYFEDLTNVLNEGDDAKVAESVVVNWAADYFTWRNKSGNYEVGGLQYIFGSQYLNFNSYTIWNYQENFDLYLTQYGRDHLPQVSAVTVIDTTKTDDFEYRQTDAPYSMTCYIVRIKIEYEADSVLDPSGFPEYATIYVADNGGRYEIVEVYAFGEGYEEQKMEFQS